MTKQSFVYILSNYSHSVLYIGVTNNLIKRIAEHKQGIGSEFTKRYTVTKLVYYEIFEDITSAIKREKQLKGGSRKDKEILISKMNPQWNDLYSELC